jgi:hypothetical protein
MLDPIHNAAAPVPAVAALVFPPLIAPGLGEGPGYPVGERVHHAIGAPDQRPLQLDRVFGHWDTPVERHPAPSPRGPHRG